MLGKLFQRYFAFHEKEHDINKDAQGEGTLERFIDTLGEDLDEELVTLIDNLLPNLLEPAVAMERFIPYLESSGGMNERNDTLYLSSAMVFRRAVVRGLSKYHNIKGTLRCYEVLFGMLGISLGLADVGKEGGLDSEITFDEVTRKFDSTKANVTGYQLNLTGTLPLTEQLIRAITSIIIFNNPVDVKMPEVVYNDLPLVTNAGDFNGDFSNDYYALPN